MNDTLTFTRIYEWDNTRKIDVSEYEKYIKSTLLSYFIGNIYIYLL